MSRKSRRNMNKTDDAVAVDVKPQIYPTAIYVRLSVENLGREDNGTTIENQKDVCREYIRDFPDLHLVKVYEDNGWSGTVMHRPAFDEMMEDIKSGVIKAVVVRDLSRFSRDYIDAGTYLERIFPMLGVRFISVKENIDTLKVGDISESLIVPIHNIINDFYAKDISRKVDTATQIQMRNGTLRWGNPPYGYKKNADRTNIVPDEERAKIVRKIFAWAVEGYSFVEIHRKLVAENAIGSVRSAGKNIPVDRAYIKHILENPVYIGVRIMGKTHKALHKGLKKEKMPPEKWYVFPNSHEALVSCEIFEKAQAILNENREKYQRNLKRTAAVRESMVNLFQNKIFCADCGGRMYYGRIQSAYGKKNWQGRYLCSSYHRKMVGHECTSHHILKDKLDTNVLSVIQTHIRIALDYEKLLISFQNSDRGKRIRSEMEKSIRNASQKLANIQWKRTRLYEDYVEGILDEKEYSFAKKSYDEESDRQNKLLEELVAKRNAYLEAMSPQNLWVKTMGSVQRMKKLSQELVDATIECVYVHDGGNLEIVMKYQDIFELTKSYLEGGKSGV